MLRFIATEAARVGKAGDFSRLVWRWAIVKGQEVDTAVVTKCRENNYPSVRGRRKLADGWGLYNDAQAAGYPRPGQCGGLEECGACGNAIVD